MRQLFQSCEYDIRFDNAQHLRLIDEGNVNGFSNLLLAKRWRIILTEDPYRFITSDNPVAEWSRLEQGFLARPSQNDRTFLPSHPTSSLRHHPVKS